MTLQLPGYSHFTNNPLYTRRHQSFSGTSAGSADGRVVIDLALWSGACSLCLLEQCKHSRVDPGKSGQRRISARPRVVLNPVARAFCIFAEQLPSCCNTRECSRHRYSRQRPTSVQRH